MSTFESEQGVQFARSHERVPTFVSEHYKEASIGTHSPFRVALKVEYRMPHPINGCVDSDGSIHRAPSSGGPREMGLHVVNVRRIQRWVSDDYLASYNTAENNAVRCVVTQEIHPH
jgi:hypothetical protein